MKALLNTKRHPTALSLLWVLLCLIFLSGCRAIQTQDLIVPAPTQSNPPMPQEPATNLQMPAPVIAEPIYGRALLPGELSLGFAMDVADIVVVGDWDIRGRVLAFEDQTVSFRTDKGETGHLVFRLPEGIRFPLFKPEQPIFIQRKLRGYESSLGYELQVTSSERLVLSSGSIAGGESQTVSLAPKVLLQQVSEQTSVLGQSKYETTYQVQVVLNIDGVPTELSIGKPLEFSIDGVVYLLLVTQSNQVQPTKEYEGVLEGSGYYLEYVMILK